MACRLLGLLLTGSLCTNFSEFFLRNSHILIQENAFESVVCEMAAILLNAHEVLLERCGSRRSFNTCFLGSVSMHSCSLALSHRYQIHSYWNLNKTQQSENCMRVLSLHYRHMNATWSQITGNSTVYPTVCSQAKIKAKSHQGVQYCPFVCEGNSTLVTGGFHSQMTQ